MNLKLVSSTVTIATAATAVSMAIGTPAQALIVAGSVSYSPLLEFPTTLTVSNEFANNINPGLGFTDVSNILVNSLLLQSGSLSGAPFNANYDTTPAFLSNFKFKGQDAQLTLLPGDQVIHTTGNTESLQFASTTNVIFSGIIEKLDGTDLAKVLGNFGAGETFSMGQRVASFRMDVRSVRVLDDVEEIPTPALLPAALGFGAAMLRKRKGQTGSQAAARTES
ncbi:PTPA-CTERM sorting domain-containing protein [Leptolyngbya ohadii]|uniref:PTPA-CTERM sorting domain-containing protein n=1 Tax=Leptolyngbya ohadii TaxID=1962290 RepID=UPI000B59F03F|nr:PTPA-CTERM sorting domain-containing protein [Leptolyngbya ohadii]